MLDVLGLEYGPQFRGEWKHAAVAILRRPAVEPDGTCEPLTRRQLFVEVDLPPFEGQNLAVDSPTGDSREPDDRLQRCRQPIADSLKLFPFKEPRTNVPFRQHRDVRPMEQLA